MHTNKPKIFGIGLSKTATTSLASALEMLGYKTRDYLGITNYVPGDLSASIDLKEIDANDAFTDTPIPSFYKELDAEYPGSKFILTIRDREAWLKSCKKQFTPILAEKVNEAGNQVFLDLYGCTSFDEEKFTNGYNRYVNGVMEYFKDRGQDLMVIDLCNGGDWQALCSFLGKPAPDVPFPMSNVSSIQWININDVINVAKQAGQKILKIYEKSTINEPMTEVNLLKKMYRKTRLFFQVDKNELLTKANKLSNRIIVNGLNQLKPTLPILSKEDNEFSVLERQNWHHYWLVDPLDGAEEFLNKDGRFTVNIALIQDGKPMYGVVYDVVKDTLYYSKGKSRGFKVVGDCEPERINMDNVNIQNKLAIADKNDFSDETKEFLEDQGIEYELMSASTALKFCMVAEGKATIYPVFRKTMEWQTAAAHAIVKSSDKTVSNYISQKELSYNKDNLANNWLLIQ